MIWVKKNTRNNLVYENYVQHTSDVYHILKHLHLSTSWRAKSSTVTFYYYWTGVIYMIYPRTVLLFSCCYYAYKCEIKQQNIIVDSDLKR